MKFIIEIGATHPIFFMVYFSFLQDLLLEHLSIIVLPKVSTIWLKNSSDPIGFSLKVTEILPWHTFSIYFLLINSKKVKTILD
jgi:hypothetical protein